MKRTFERLARIDDRIDAGLPDGWRVAGVECRRPHPGQPTVEVVVVHVEHRGTGLSEKVATVWDDREPVPAEGSDGALLRRIHAAMKAKLGGV